MIWAVDVDLPYVADYTLGAILLVSGLVSIGVASVAQLKQRRARGSYDAGYRQTYRY